MSADPIRIEDVDIEKLSIQVPKKEPDGGRKIFNVMHNNQRLRIVMPEMKAPFGAGPGRTAETANKFSMGISFEGMNDESDKKRARRLRRAHEKAVEIDNKIETLILDMKESFWKDAKKKGITEETLRSRYKNFVRTHEDENKPDMMYLSLQPRSLKQLREPVLNKMSEEAREDWVRHFKSMPNYDFLIDDKGNAIETNIDNISEVVPWGSFVKPVIEFAYLTVVSDNVFPVWTLVHGLLSSTNHAKNFDLRRMDDSDEEDGSRDEDGEEEVEHEEGEDDNMEMADD